MTAKIVKIEEFEFEGKRNLEFQINKYLEEHPYFEVVCVQKMRPGGEWATVTFQTRGA